MPRRFFKREPNKICSKCESNLDENRIGMHYCRKCQNEFQRKSRKKHSELTEGERKKANARSYLHVYIRRGIIHKKPCEKCGDPNVQAHHKDYSKPLEVRWLCVKCHIELHKNSTVDDFMASEIAPAVRSMKGIADDAGMIRYEPNTCSRCNAPRDRNGRYCRKCHSAYMREFRKKQKEEAGRALEFYNLHHGQ